MRARSNSAVRRHPAHFPWTDAFTFHLLPKCVYISQRAFTFHLLPDPIAKIETRDDGPPHKLTECNAEVFQTPKQRAPWTALEPMRAPAHQVLVLAAILKAGLAGADRNASVSQRLRYDLLGNLDPKVPPTTFDMIGTQIHVQYRIFKVLSIDVATGMLVLKVWRRTWWFDDRLKFDPADYGGLETIEAYPRAPNLAWNSPDNRLWLPHIVTHNSITSEETTLEYGAAWIRHDGRVWHSVPGTVDVTCRFSGLAAFPRDTLSCPMEIASWSLPDTVTNLTFFSDPTDEEALAQGDRGCAEISPQSAAAASSYQEFQIDRVECLKYTRYYPCCATVPWTQLWINIYVKRAGSYYTRLIEVPSTMLACLSFAAFFLHPASAGERIGFGSTMVLAQFVLIMVVGDKLPTCGELLWIDVLLSLNVIFTFVALLESCYVTYIGMSFPTLKFKEAKQKAEKADSIARWTILPFFFVLLCFAYNMESVEDTYSIDPCLSGVCPVTIGGKELGKEGLKYLPSMAVGFGWTRVSIKWGVGLLAPLVLLALLLAWKLDGKRVQLRDLAQEQKLHHKAPTANGEGWKSDVHPWRLEQVLQVHLPLGTGDHVQGRWSTTTHNNRGDAPRARTRPQPPPPEVGREAPPSLGQDVATPSKARDPFFPRLRNSAARSSAKLINSEIWRRDSLRKGWSGRNSTGEGGAGESSIRYSA